MVSTGTSPSIVFCLVRTGAELKKLSPLAEGPRPPPSPLVQPIAELV